MIIAVVIIALFLRRRRGQLKRYVLIRLDQFPVITLPFRVSQSNPGNRVTRNMAVPVPCEYPWSIQPQMSFSNEMCDGADDTIIVNNKNYVSVSTSNASAGSSRTGISPTYQPAHMTIRHEVDAGPLGRNTLSPLYDHGWQS